MDPDVFKKTQSVLTLISSSKLEILKESIEKVVMIDLISKLNTQ
jgi:hypothetical protein